MDIRGVPTHVCPCGSQLWKVKTIFRDYQVAMYMLDMECYECGTLATAPTLEDMPHDYVPEDMGDDNYEED